MNSKAFTIYLWFSIASSIPIGVYLVYKYLNALRNRPLIHKSEIVFQERFASGYSMKNVLTRFGGARNCLRLVVTKDVLWITSWFPFSLITSFYDLEHVVPHNRISTLTNGQPNPKEILLTYADRSGATHSLRLFPKNLEGFLRALDRMKRP